MVYLLPIIMFISLMLSILLVMILSFIYGVVKMLIYFGKKLIKKLKNLTYFKNFEDYY